MAKIKIVNCFTAQEKIVNTKSTINLGGVYSFFEYPGDCWTVDELEPADEGIEGVTVDKVFEDCNDCRLEELYIYTALNCETQEQEFISCGSVLLLGNVYRFQETDDICFRIEANSPFEVPNRNLTVDLQSEMSECDYCLDRPVLTVYVGIDCENESVIYFTSELDVNMSIYKIGGRCYQIAGIDPDANPSINLETLDEYTGCMDCLGIQMEDVYVFRNCETQKNINVKTSGDFGEGVTYAFKFMNGCYTYVGRDSSFDYVVDIVMKEFVNCEECLDDKTCIECETSDRTIAYSNMVRLPKPKQPDKGFKECCYDNYVFAEMSGNEYERNDFNGFYFKRQSANDGCDFTLVDLGSGNEYALNNQIYGKYVNFGGVQSNLTFYIVEWQKVLQVLGEGNYQIKKTMTVAGLVFDEFSNTFKLREFSNELADKTVRLDCVMNGELVHFDVNFKGTDFRTSVRTIGYFGNRDPKYAQDNIVKRNYDTIQVSMSQENEYQFQTGLLPSCITTEIYDFILFGNEIFANDYNLANHDYSYVKFPVKLSDNKGSNYFAPIRDARINLTFSDANVNKRKINC